MRQLATCDLALFVWREMAELPATLVKKKNAKSMVWVYFGLTDYQKRECEGCASPMVRSTGQCAERVRKPWCAKVGTPPTSLSIFEALHSDLHKEATQGKTDTSKGKEPTVTQPTLTTVIEKGRQYDRKSFQRRNLIAQSCTILRRICSLISLSRFQALGRYSVS